MNFTSLNSPSPRLFHCKPSLIKSLPTCHTPPFFALMDCDAGSGSGSGSGPSSCSYADFYPLQYPHNVLTQEDTCINYACNNAASSSSPTFDAPDMSAPDFFADSHVDFLHPGTPSSASSGSGLMTPVSTRGATRFPAIASGSDEGGDDDMDGVGKPAGIPVDFHNPLLTTDKSDSDEPHVDWPQLLAALYSEHPETARWFAQTRTFQQGSDSKIPPPPQDEHGFLMQQEPSSPSSLIYPQQHSDTLAEFLASLDDPTSYLSPTLVSSSLSSDLLSEFIPLHQPQPVRPIPHLKLKELAAAALRLARPRGPREANTLSSMSLLCQSVDDSIRYQRNLGNDVAFDR